MRYQIRERLLCLGDDFDIRDESGRLKFHVDGRAFTLLREKLSIKDPAGEEVAFIRERIVTIRKAYEIHRGGDRVAVVKKDLFNLFRVGFTVDVEGPDDYEAKGSILEHEYTFRRHGKVVAQVSKKWFTIRDTYAVDIEDGQDDVIILASAIVIDQICHDRDAADGDR